MLRHPVYLLYGLSLVSVATVAEYRGWAVPDVLLSGHHRDIERRRRGEALRRTMERRPEILTEREGADHERD